MKIAWDVRTDNGVLWAWVARWRAVAGRWGSLEEDKLETGAPKFSVGRVELEGPGDHPRGDVRDVADSVARAQWRELG